jgi:hypothetical protein
MGRLGRHLALVAVRRRDAVHVDIVDQVPLYDLDIGELLVEMMRQQLHGVFQLALRVVQGALAEISRHQGGADRDCRDQQAAAKHEPADRAAAHDGGDADRRGRFLAHVFSRSEKAFRMKGFRNPGRCHGYRSDVELRLASLVNETYAKRARKQKMPS